MRLKPSPYHIFVFLYKRSLILFALPLQGFILNNINPQITSYIFLTNMALVSAFVFSAYLSYRNMILTFSKKTVKYESGIIVRSHISAHRNSISVFSAVQSPLQKLLRIYRVTFVLSKRLISVYLPKKCFSMLSAFFHPAKRQKKLIFQSGLFPTILLSAGLYNAFTNVLTIIPVFNRTSRLLSNHTSYEPFDLPMGINLILSATTIFISALWLTGALVTFFRFYNLKVYTDNKAIEITRGFWVKRFFSVNPQHVSALVLRQNILMSMLHRYTGEFRIACDKKENRLTFICGENHKRCVAITSLLIKDFPKNSDCYILKKIRPYKNALWGYTYLPTLSLIVFSSLSVIADVYSPYISKTYLSLFVTLWLSVWFLFRVSVFRRCFVSLYKDTLLICTYKKMTFSKAYIPKDKILSAKVTESFFQRRAGTCSLTIYAKSRKSQTFRIKHINNKKAAELVSELCG